MHLNVLQASGLLRHVGRYCSLLAHYSAKESSPIGKKNLGVRQSKEFMK